MSAAPTKVQFLTAERLLLLEWPDDGQHRIPYRILRQLCPCANCVSELTGERLLDPETIPEHIEPTDVDYVGSYALKIVWNDSHDSGLFTWEYLNELGTLVASHGATNDD